MNYREAWANGEIEAGTLVDRIEEQEREIDWLTEKADNWDKWCAKAHPVKAQPRGLVLPEPMKRGEEGGSGEYGAAMIRGYNACLREVARLNQPASSAQDGPCGFTIVNVRLPDRPLQLGSYAIPASAGVYSADPLECSGCVSGCFRCGTEQNKAASLGDEPIRYWFIGDAGQEAGSRHCKKSTRDGSLALFESEHDAKRAARRHPGTEVYPVDYYRSPQARAAIAANHSEQVRVPEGWQLVPVEASEEMIATSIDLGRIDPDEVLGIWEAMLAAAPSAGSQGGDV